MYSTKAAGLAVSMGYTNVFVFREGIPGWREAGYTFVTKEKYPKVDIPFVSAAELAEIDKLSAEIVDIRQAEHFQKGHVAESLNLSLENLHEQLDALPKDKKIVLVDHKGKLTLTVGRFLASKGFEDLARLSGGFNAWVKTGLPIDK